MLAEELVHNRIQRIHIEDVVKYLKAYRQLRTGKRGTEQRIHMSKVR
jgi:hypothetical protein